ncbi:NAD(P)/FAD-dependent oxidoreductase [Ramlibacter sp.]|uniref:NAD(P)/FAD-dependent oxidoreductase n=1 Tax=Ramlibacter sp. TaxID=1917967 RepID=UPI003D0A5B9C
MRTIAIAGASLAGLNAAQELRAANFGGRIVMVGREAGMPYDRPPLSKQMLEGTMPAAELALDCKPELDLDWRLGRAASRLDVAGKTLTLDDGETLAFDGLVIATGASPRRLPFGTLAGMHVLRTREDAQALKADLERKPARVVVIGGGFIGAEVASTCRALGIAVTIVEPLPGLLLRVLGAAVSAHVDRIHAGHGVDLLTGRQAVGALADGAGRVRAVQLADGSEVACEVVVVAIGVTPDTAWLQGSGLDVSDGVLCDATCLAAPGIVAAGDIARWPNVRFDECRRVEHWENAVQQGRHAARTLLAMPASPAQNYTPVPWVWSDQFGLKLQVYGSTVGHEEVLMVDPPSDDDPKFIALYRRGHRLAGIAGIGKVRAVLGWRRLLGDGASWDDALSHAKATRG